MTDKPYDALFKILVTGNSGVGKSSLLTRYSDKTYYEDCVPTVGVDFKVETLEINGKRIKLQLWDTGGQERYRTITKSYYRGCYAVFLVYDVTNQWDTGGQERYRTITKSYYRGCYAVFLVYDVTNQESFVEIKDWLRDVDTYAWGDAIKVIVGNKSDRADRVVDINTAKVFAAQEGVEVIEVSAKTGDNVEELFTTTASKLLEIFPDGKCQAELVRVDSGPRRRQAGCCSVM